MHIHSHKKQPHTGPKAAENASFAGQDTPTLFTLARDGALFSWGYDAPVVSPTTTTDEEEEGEEESDGMSEEEEEEEQDDEEQEEEEEEDNAHQAHHHQQNGARKRQKTQPQLHNSTKRTSTMKGTHAPHQTHTYVGGRWRLLGKQFLWQQGATVSAADYHRPTAMLLVAYTSGLFELYQV